MDEPNAMLIRGKHKQIMKTIKTLSLLLLPVAAAASLQAQSALDTFESYGSGNNLSTPLNGGTGWNGSWVTANATTASGVVSSTSPLGSGDNQYLGVSLANSSAGQAVGLGRGLAGGAPTGDYTVSFLWRPDSLTGFGGSANDRFEFYSSSSAATVNSGGTGGNTTTTPYLFGVFGGARGVNYTSASASALLFGVYASPTVGGAFVGDNYYNLGSVATGGNGTTLGLVAGTTYSITIDVFASSQTWNISVTDGSTTAYSTGLNWWGSNTQPFIGFGARGSAANEARTFSIDNLQVQSVPEPGSVALLALGGAILPFLRRRHR